MDEWQEYPDNTWAAFEVKIGFSAQDEAAANLLAFTGEIDQERMGVPASLTVITVNGFVCRRRMLRKEHTYTLFLP